jgi:hypothetical protein
MVSQHSQSAESSESSGTQTETANKRPRTNHVLHQEYIRSYESFTSSAALPTKPGSGSSTSSNSPNVSNLTHSSFEDSVNQEASLHDSKADDETVLVGGLRKHIRDITDEDKELMNEEEYLAYYEMMATEQDQ